MITPIMTPLKNIVIAFCVDCPIFVKTDLQKIESLIKNGLGKKNFGARQEISGVCQELQRKLSSIRQKLLINGGF